jgi:hypothetical protein
MTTAPVEAGPQAERPAFLGPDLSPDEQAPHGYTVDRLTGAVRPKKKPGRPLDAARPAGPDGGSPPPAPPGPPSLEQLKAAAAGKAAAAPDRPPGAAAGRRGGPRASKPPADVPAFRAGPIAKGVNSLYRKAGKIVRIGDPDIGNAIIACTRKQVVTEPDGSRHADEDDVTVGEAWEEIARTNPRIRAFLLKLISGGAWTQLFMAHAPIALAVLLKDGIRQRIPFHRLLDAMLADDDGEPLQDDDDDDGDGPRPPDFSSMLGSLTPEDMAQMSGMFGGMMSQMAGRMPRSPGPARAPVVDEPPGPGP